MAQRILICDDEGDIRESLRAILTDEGYDVTAVSAGPNAVAEAPDHDALLLDIKMPGQDGLETLAQIRKRGVPTPVVMISGHGDVRTAMEAIRAGANDFLEKPLATEHVLNALRRVLDASRLTRENLELRSRLGLTRLVGEAPVMKKLLADVARVAPTPATILIVGPSGTGKELVARSVHDASAVKAGPFIQVNCAAIPETLIESELFGHEKGSFTGAERKQVGKFVEADGGTIFLDEIGDMSRPRVVRVKVRVVAATNRDLTEMIRQGRFREDLYYRLNVIPLRTPALAEHPEDVPALVLHFAELFARTNNYRSKRFTDEALMALAARPWPGNVRELKNHVERLMIMTDGDVVDSVDVEAPGEARPEAPVVVRDGRVVREGEPETAPEGGLAAPAPVPLADTPAEGVWARLLAVKTLQDFQDEAEKLYLVAKLAENGGNVTRTAESVETPRSNLYKKMDRYGLKKREEGTA